MRGCLFIVVLAVLVAAIVAVVGLPVVASAAVTAALNAGGLQSKDMQVVVSSQPTTEILGLHADRIEIAATDATYRELEIGQLELDLRDVSLTTREAKQVSGVFRTVVVASSDPKDPLDGLHIPAITIDGGGSAINASAAIAGEDVEALVARAVKEKTGSQPTGVALAEPDRLTIVVSGLTIAGRMSIGPDGALVMRPQGSAGSAVGEVTLVDADSLPFTLRSVEVTGGQLILGGRLAGLP